MLRTLRSFIILVWVGLLLPISINLCYAQEIQTDLKSYLTGLEKRFDIKFSYVDEDLEKVEISTPVSNSLQGILESIRAQTQIKIEKLNERYYTLVKSTLVDICAKVLDNFAENTVSAASVEVVGSEIALVTDSEGLFSLRDIPREALIRIRFLGYVTKYVPVESLIARNDCPKILLAQNYEQLEEVVLYEFLAPGIIKQTDASITLNTYELGILPGLVEPDVLQTVQALPGIKSIDETVSDINVRGGTNDQNLILWNGIKMYQSGHFFGLISAFNPYLTDKVTVFKNGTPTQYGDGVSSVISMETKNDIDGFFTGGAGINFISGDVYGQIPIKDNMAFQFSARRSTTDFLNTPTYNNFTDRAFQDSEVKNQQNQTIDENFQRDETFFFYDFSGKLLYDINDKHQLRFNFITIANDLEFTETNLDIDETTLSLLDQTNISGGIRLQSNWTDKFSSNLNIYYTKYNLDAQSLFGNQVQTLFQNNRVTENALKIDTNYTISENLDWTNGYQFIETGIKNFTQISQPNFLSNITGVIRIHAPYTEIGYTAEENKFIARAGVRVNYIENLATFNELLIEPRLNLNFRVAKYLRAEILGEFKSQSTNQVIDLEQNFLGIEKRRWIISDGNELPITKSKQGSLGLNYSKNALYIGLEGFYKYVDGISIRTQGFQNENQFGGEIGNYDVKGIEFLINKKGDNYSTWFSYTFNKNDYNFTNITPNSFPNNLDVRHTLTFASTYSIKDLKLGLGINYRTGKPFTKPEADNPLDTSFFPARINYETPNSSRLPEYVRMDASASYGFDMGRRVKANAGISLLNLTNRENLLNRYYRLSDTNEIETVENVSLGITPNVSFRVSF
ncbi:TonB-dependent receptor [Flagellimonas eckloniae]|uniref:TonB-dependent receptor n=1 Tax=Flagellimonas eckloniae TaxID=346185 RepID=A0A0Q0XK58_9FLAO|nr:carboxypeptidase-like regulatory domain-containing protein [Allomuricauda eckloniae]KQC31274.1 TonB-dependent receptor [Allomuricauda eckloniae]